MSKFSAIFFCLALTCSSVVMVMSAPANPADKISSGLKKSLETKLVANVIVTMAAGTQSAYDEIALGTFATRQERATAAYKALNALAATSQGDVLEMLRSAKYSTLKVQSFWISNQIAIDGADKALVELLAGFESVGTIEEEQIIRLEEPVQVGPILHSRPKANSWGVEKIQAEEAWEHLDGNNGTGVVIGVIDTGARISHEALRNSYKGGTHAWFNAYSTANALPVDGHGHGTHVTGTIAGSFGIGVCPGAKWIACKGLGDDGTATTAALTRCGEFMACPTDYQGNNPDCNQVPDIVSNSWGSAGGNTFFEAVITAWRNAAIIPVFANGNSGESGCRTTGSPADSIRVIAVGATDEGDAITSWSGRGPTNGGAQKPDISAPGALIVSAGHTSDAQYVTFSGTSMACPHAAGVAGILRAQNPTASYATVRNALINKAERNLAFTGEVCNFVEDNTFPNYQHGYGRINALAAVQTMEKMMKHNK